MNFPNILGLCLLLATTTLGGFYEGTPVIELTKDNFKERVINSKTLWIVEFYAPWCGHCKQLAPEYIKAAKALEGIIRMGAVNMDDKENQQVGSPYGVKGFPTLKFFGGDKAKPTDYNGQRTADGLISFSIGEAQKLAKSRLSGGGKSSSGNKQKTEQKKKEGENTKTKTGGSDVMELDSSNFDTTLVDSTDMWMIVFYAPWCGHCKRLHPEWDKAAAALKGVAKFGKVDADADKELNNRYGIRGFPTIKVFMPGGDLDKPITYEEGRDEPAFIAYVNKMMDGKIPNPLTQLITSKIFNDKCMKDSKLCLLIFLPHMIDSTVEGRNAYLKIVEDIAVKHRSRPINYFWLQAGDQSALEQSFNLGFGFPAVVAYSPNKKVYSTLKAAFSKEGLVQFVESMFIRKANVLKIENIGEIVDSLAWDGKQYTPPPEDDDDDLLLLDDL